MFQELPKHSGNQSRILRLNICRSEWMSMCLCREWTSPAKTFVAEGRKSLLAATIFPLQAHFKLSCVCAITDYLLRHVSSLRSLENERIYCNGFFLSLFLHGGEWMRFTVNRKRLIRVVLQAKLTNLIETGLKTDIFNQDFTRFVLGYWKWCGGAVQYIKFQYDPGIWGVCQLQTIHGFASPDLLRIFSSVRLSPLLFIHVQSKLRFRGETQIP